MVIATTHYDALKTYASTTDGVASAAFGFDPTTFAPTYRLNYGSPGSSLALEIATRLGLPASIIEAARRIGAIGKRSSPSTWRRSSETCRRSNTSVAWRRASARRSRRRRRKMQAREQELRNREETFTRPRWPRSRPGSRSSPTVA